MKLKNEEISAKQFHTTQIRSMTRRDILEKHWKNYRISIGVPYEPMSERAYEEMEKAMEEYAQIKLQKDTKTIIVKA